MLWAAGPLPVRKGSREGPESEEGNNAQGLLLENTVLQSKCYHVLRGYFRAC